MAYIYHTTVLVSDFAKSRDFYDQLFSFLGWEVYAEDEYAKAWSHGDFAFWITEAKDKTARRNPDGTGIDHLAFRVETKQEVDACHELLKSIGVQIEIPPQSFPEYSEKYYALFFFDYDGTRFEVIYT